MNKQLIKQYVDQGFSIFPCNMDKTPFTSNGFKDAHKDIDKLNKQFYKSDMYIGLPTGKINGIVVIDFDVNKKIPGTDDIDTRSVDQLLDEVKENYGEFPDTLIIETPSSGQHYYYRLPDGYDQYIGPRSRFLNKFLPIDIRCDGGYVIAPDEENYFIYDDDIDDGINGLRSRMSEVPSWILDYGKEKSTLTTTTQDELTNILPEGEIREIRSALSYISSDDRDTWINIAMILKSTKSPSAFGLWNEWSKTSAKYNPDDIEKRWNGLKPKELHIGSLFHEAKKYGWVTTYERTAQLPTVSKKEIVQQNQEIDLKEIKKIQDSIKKEPFPKHLLRPPGLVGDIIDFIIARSPYEQPIFALSAALTAVGALAGRKVRTRTDVRTNIYCLNVGDSGCGKDKPRKVIKQLFELAGCEALAGTDTISSDAAIETRLRQQPSQVFLLDEIGRFFKSTSKGSPAFLTKIVDVLLRMYGNCDETYYCKSYADEGKDAKIYQPNLCLLGSTVPDSLYKGLSYESATDGFLSRMLIFETDNNLPRRSRDKDTLIEPSEHLLEQVRKLHRKPINIDPKGDIDKREYPRPQFVEMSDNAKQILLNFEEEVHIMREKMRKEKKIDCMYNRVVQQAIQIALIVATGIDSDNPVITEEEILYGIELSNHLMRHLQYVVENHMARNDYEHEVKMIYNIIRDAGKISLSQLSRKTQHLAGYIREGMIETLKDSEQIDEKMIGTGKFMTRMFFLT